MHINSVPWLDMKWNINSVWYVFYKNSLAVKVFQTPTEAKNELHKYLIKSIVDNNSELCDCFIKKYDDIFDYIPTSPDKYTELIDLMQGRLMNTLWIDSRNLQPYTVKQYE